MVHLAKMKTLVVVLPFFLVVSTHAAAAGGYIYQQPSSGFFNEQNGAYSHQSSPNIQYLPAVGLHTNSYFQNPDHQTSNYQTASSSTSPTEQALPQINKYLYFYGGEDVPLPTPSVIFPQVKPKQNHKLIFIKAPSYVSPPPAIIPLQPQYEEKTKVYVLVKNPEPQAPIIIPSSGSVIRSKPEVYFINYKTQEDAERQIKESLNGVGGQTPATPLQDGKAFVDALGKNGKITNDTKEEVYDIDIRSNVEGPVRYDDGSITGVASRASNLDSSNLGSSHFGSSNFGSINSGSSNFGSSNLGSSNFGSSNLDSSNVQSSNFGSSNLGSSNLGSSNLDSSNLGSNNLGSSNLGSSNLGSSNLASSNIGSSTHYNGGSRHFDGSSFTNNGDSKSLDLGVGNSDFGSSSHGASLVGAINTPKRFNGEDIFVPPSSF